MCLIKILEMGNSAMHDGCCGPWWPYLNAAANSGTWSPECKQVQT